MPFPSVDLPLYDRAGWLIVIAEVKNKQGTSLTCEIIEEVSVEFRFVSGYGDEFSYRIRSQFV